MERSQTINELSAALVAAQGEFTAVPKDGANPFFKSRYASLPKVVEVASPILTKHGLAVSQFLGHDGDGDTLTTWLIHASGQYIHQAMRLHLGKDDTAQAQGSATTYARRYAYMAVLGLVADEDDDGNKASDRQPPARKVADSPKAADAPIEPALLTPEQRTKVVARIDTAGLQLPMVLAALGISTINDLTTGHFDRIIQLIEKNTAAAAT